MFFYVMAHSMALMHSMECTTIKLSIIILIVIYFYFSIIIIVIALHDLYLGTSLFKYIIKSEILNQNIQIIYIIYIQIIFFGMLIF